MTTDHKPICDAIRKEIELFETARLNPGLFPSVLKVIEAQDKQIAGYVEQHGRDSAELRRLCDDRDSWRDQCSQRVKDWHAEHERVKALEAKCALLAASLAQAEREKDDAEKHAAEVSNANFELESKVAAAEKATRFAGLVLAQHRNDGYPGDVDGDDLQRFALESGMIEERLVESSCGSECSCADVGEFPTTCYFNI